MHKRIRRDRRTILVDDRYTAEDIYNYCISKIFHYVNCNCWCGQDKCVHDGRFYVTLYCTAEDWKQIETDYNLVKTKNYNRKRGMPVDLEYELSKNEES